MKIRKLKIFLIIARLVQFVKFRKAARDIRCAVVNLGFLGIIIFYSAFLQSCYSS